jgi:hypothetical protein
MKINFNFGFFSHTGERRNSLQFKEIRRFSFEIHNHSDINNILYCGKQKSLAKSIKVEFLELNNSK